MPAAAHAAPRPVVYLHIGPQKSGTTYLQNLMVANRDRLAEQGVNFAGKRWRDQVQAVNDLLEGSPAPGGAWERMARSMARHDGTSVLSMEFLASCTPDQVRTAVQSLEPAEVHVVLTLRDVVSAAPSQWQTGVRSGKAISWKAYARTMPWAGYVPISLARQSRFEGMRHFARLQGVPWIIDTWLKVVPPERFHVVVVPPSGSDPTLLWQRFAAVIGVDPDSCPEPPAYSRPSLGYASTSLIARVNRRVARRRSVEYRRTVRSYLATKVLTLRSKEEEKIPLTRGVYRAGLRLNAANLRHVRRRGVQVTGDLSEIVVEPDRERLAGLPRRAAPPAQDQLLAAAELAVRGLEAQIRVRSGEPAPDEVAAESLGPRTQLTERWRQEPQPVRAAVSEVTRLAKKSMRLFPTAQGVADPDLHEVE